MLGLLQREYLAEKIEKFGYLSLIVCDFCKVGKICIFVYDPFMKGTTLLASLIFVTSRYFGSFSSLVFLECREIIEICCLWF